MLSLFLRDRKRNEWVSNKNKILRRCLVFYRVRDHAGWNKDSIIISSFPPCIIFLVQFSKFSFFFFIIQFQRENLIINSKATRFFVFCLVHSYILPFYRFYLLQPFYKLMVYSIIYIYISISVSLGFSLSTFYKCFRFPSVNTFCHKSFVFVFLITFSISIFNKYFFFPNVLQFSFVNI